MQAEGAAITYRNNDAPAGLQISYANAGAERQGSMSCRQPTSASRVSKLPGVGEAACQEGMSSESPEPLAGRLGAPAQRRHRV